MAKKKAASGEPTGAKKQSLEAVESDFESSLKAVEQVVRQLESGELTLDQSLAAYEQGVRRLRQCHQHLGKVEQRIELLVGFDRDGQPVTQPFDDESGGAGKSGSAGKSWDFADNDDATDDDAEDDKAMDLF